MKSRHSFWYWAKIILLFTGFVFLIVFTKNTKPVYAAEPTPVPQPKGPDRFTSIKVDIAIYEWWMAAWRDNNVFCSFYVDYAGLPSDSDILTACGKDLYDEWKTFSAPCLEKNSTNCPGYYFIPISSRPEKRDVTVKLPPPDVRVYVEGCQPDATGWCTQQPSLVLSAQDPLPNESIVSISGIAGSDSFSCEGSLCKFKLSETKQSGVRVTFWANSTYGDSSAVFDALLLVKMDGVTGDRLTPRWYVDVISSQWKGTPIASCAAAWDAFPPTDGLPQWLSTPSSSIGLQSNIPYNYLAANLITQGVTDASACPDHGLMSDGSANACGMKAAAKDVKKWQNRFDKLIFKVAKGGDVPAQLLKNLFSRESQFWPGVFKSGKDVGLGQMTEGGADTAMLWNPSFYENFCPLVLNKSLCQAKGFANLKPAQKALLRGALVQSVDARCEDCPLGLDLSRADFSVSVFAHTLRANCEQAGKIVQNVTDAMPGTTVDYETMWRLTLVNYNAGSGCLADAVSNAYDPSVSDSLSWGNISAALQISCPGSAAYVEDVTREVDQVPVEPTPTPDPGGSNG